MLSTKQKQIKCPVCNETYLSHAMKLHITNAGKIELYKHIEAMMRASKNKPYTFSPAVILRGSPHYNYRRKHITTKKVFEI